MSETGQKQKSYVRKGYNKSRSIIRFEKSGERKEIA